MTPFDLILHFSLGPLVANLRAKFEVSIFRDVEGLQNANFQTAKMLPLVCVDVKGETMLSSC